MYWMGRENLGEISPGDTIRVTTTREASFASVPEATRIVVLMNVDTGGVFEVASTLEEAREESRHRWARENYRGVAAVVLPLLFSAIMGVGLALRYVLARQLDWDRRFFPATPRVYMVLALISLPILAFAAWRLYRYVYYMVNYGLA